MSKVTKIYTGLAGMPVCQEPHKEILYWIGKNLRSLAKLPLDSKYRTMNESLINEKKSVVESTESPEEIERKLGFQCEEIIEDLKKENELVTTMAKYKAWEPLSDKPPADQWKRPV